ncbi:hypothetical protein [Pontibacter pamirensis]|uniref:hypothetical protein n=1 Tax=Pontibacter pamirensis TaxID=2562824 RepID=UPI001389747D|nr:hypothetical protein [Pontibacter pamirensis]
MHISIIRLSDNVGFFQAYLESVASKKHKTKEQTYEATEELRINHFGFRKFSNYDSFKTALCRYRKDKKNLPHPVTQAKRAF